MNGPHYAEIDDLRRKFAGNPHYQPDRFEEAMAKEQSDTVESWIADIEQALNRAMKAMLWVTLVLALTIAVLAFAKAKVAEVQAMPRYVEGLE